jgi:hypothetical protein
MTVLSSETLLNFLDLVAGGASTADASMAVGYSPGSKSIYGYLKKSEDAGEFDARPDPLSPWSIEWNGKLDWLHIHYRQAVADGRGNRAVRLPPIRLEMEERIAAKRENRIAVVAPTMIEQRMPPESMIEIARARFTPPSPSPAPPRERPSYAFRSKPLDAVDVEPPSEGRFLMTADRPKTVAERRANTVEITDLGIRRW